jgi:hypothetical protein
MKHFVLIILAILAVSCNYSEKREAVLTREVVPMREVVPIREVVQLEQQEFRLNSKARSLVGGNDKMVRPINLPNHTIEWYYSVVATRDKKIEPVNLWVQLGPSKVGFENIKIPSGGAYCDVYLMDNANKQKFEKGEDFEYITSGSCMNFKEGKFIIKYNGSNNYYLGFRNPRELHYIDISLEVVALVEKRK